MAIEKQTRSYLDLTDIRMSSTSRLRLFNIFKDTVEKDNLLNLFKSFELTADVKSREIFFSTYNTEADDYWENISYKFYKTPNLWWLVCFMNDVVNPFEYFKEGQQIKVLKEYYLYVVYKNMQAISEL